MSSPMLPPESCFEFGTGPQVNLFPDPEKLLVFGQQHQLRHAPTRSMQVRSTRQQGCHLKHGGHQEGVSQSNGSRHQREQHCRTPSDQRQGQRRCRDKQPQQQPHPVALKQQDEKQVMHQHRSYKCGYSTVQQLQFTTALYGFQTP